MDPENTSEISINDLLMDVSDSLNNSIGQYQDLDDLLASTSHIRTSLPDETPTVSTTAPLTTTAMAATSVEPISSSVDTSIATNPTTTASGIASATVANKVYARVAPKAVGSASKVVSGTSGGQQFVIVQQNGKSQQIRLTTSQPSTSAATATSSIVLSRKSVGGSSVGGGIHIDSLPVSGNIQLIKSADGASFIQIKPAASTNLASAAPVKNANVSTLVRSTSTTAPSGSDKNMSNNDGNVASTAATNDSPSVTVSTSSATATTLLATNTASKRVVVKGSSGERVFITPARSGGMQLSTVGTVSTLAATSVAPPTLPPSAAAVATTTNAATVPTTSTVSLPSTMPRTLTVAQAQKMGLLSSARLKELVNAAKAQKLAKQQAATAAAATAAEGTVIGSGSQSSECIASSVPATAAIAAVSKSVVGITNVSASLPKATPLPGGNRLATIKIATKPQPSVSGVLVEGPVNTVTTPSATQSAPIVITPVVSAGKPTSTTTTTRTIIPTAHTALSNATAPPPPLPPTTSSSSSSLKQKVTIQTSDGSKTHVILPPSLYKMAQQGQIKAVHVAGKGVQYLRINPGVATMTAPTELARNVGADIGTTTSVSNPATADEKSTAAAAVVAAPAMLPNPTSVSSVNPATASTSATSTSSSVPGDVPLSPTPTSTTSSGPQKRKTVCDSIGNHTQTVDKTGATTTTFAITGPSGPKLLNRSIKIEQDYDAGTYRSAFTPVESSSSLSDTFGSHLKYARRSDVVPDNSTSSASGASYGAGAKVPIRTSGYQQTDTTTSESDLDGPRRKHCNCTKSQCLKLYCDCFANGEFCKDCNCKDCFNNLDYEEERQKAIRICLERNPHAFKPKIGQGKDQSDSALRRHNKGCNCKRSGCLKNYCECYEAKIACSANCKCVDCHNMDDPMGTDTFGGDSSSDNHHHYHHLHNNDLNTSSSSAGRSMLDDSQQHELASDKQRIDQLQRQRSESPDIPPKEPCNFMTPDVIEATIQCVIAQAEECQKNQLDATTSEKLILEEFGRCLVEIIEFSLKNPEN